MKKDGVFSQKKSKHESKVLYRHLSFYIWELANIYTVILTIISKFKL